MLGSEFQDLFESGKIQELNELKKLNMLLKKKKLLSRFAGYLVHQYNHRRHRTKSTFES